MGGSAPPNRAGFPAWPRGLLSVFAIGFLIPCLGFAQTPAPEDSLPYSLRPVTEGVLLTLGVGSASVGLSLWATMEEPGQGDIDALDRGAVNPFDRSATHLYSEAAATVSDVGVSILAAAPLLLMVSDIRSFRRRWRNMVTVLVMYAEAVAWTAGVTYLTKALVERPRPYLYNESVPMEEKRNNGFASFYSSHTAFAFCSAVFVSSVFSARYPEGPGRFLVWSSTLSLAAATAFLRYTAGKHFPSDILTGAAVGSLVGFLVPFLHRKRGSRLPSDIAVMPWGSKESTGIALRKIF